MCLDRKFVDAAKEAQIEMFEACPTAHKVLAHKTTLSLSAVDKHAHGESVMNMAAFNAYASAGVDPELLSLLLADGFQIMKIPRGIDHDELSRHFHEYLQLKTAAHHPDSEGGPAIGPNERAALDSKATALKAVGS